MKKNELKILLKPLNYSTIDNLKNNITFKFIHKFFYCNFTIPLSIGNNFFIKY